jgi:8-oxo-dGTP pyrophosphatase MutT (NUDIX family)
MQPSLKEIIHTLSHYHPITQKETPQSAAVLILILEQEAKSSDGILLNDDDHLSIVLTKRATTLPTYAGHFSFPGGMREANDQDLYATAIRETQEELQLSPSLYQYIGQLDDCYDRFGNLVRPYIAIMKKNDFMHYHKISLDEVAEIYLLSLVKLKLFVDDPKLYAITERRPSYSFTEENVFVWGLTATILMHLLNVMTTTTCD